MAERCEICNVNKHTKLCDYGTDSGIVRSTDFQRMTKTCDKKLCKVCAVNVWHNADLCPDHASVVREKLNVK